MKVEDCQARVRSFIDDSTKCKARFWTGVNSLNLAVALNSTTNNHNQNQTVQMQNPAQGIPQPPQIALQQINGAVQPLLPLPQLNQMDVNSLSPYFQQQPVIQQEMDIFLPLDLTPQLQFPSNKITCGI